MGELRETLCSCPRPHVAFCGVKRGSRITHCLKRASINPFTVPVTPKTLVYLRPDTIGDLVLFTSALGLFMAEWPDARHVLVVREGYEDFESPFFTPAKARVAGGPAEPVQESDPPECRRELDSAFPRRSSSLGPDLITSPRRSTGRGSEIADTPPISRRSEAWSWEALKWITTLLQPNL